MGRLVRRQLPARVPFGDTLRVKWKVQNGGTLFGQGTQSANLQIPMNNLERVVIDYGLAPGMEIYAQQFKRYRVTGVKVRFTPFQSWYDDEVYTHKGALMGWIEGRGQATEGVPTYKNVAERRWVRYKMLNFWENGGAVKTISQYFSINKLLGGDRTTATDLDYTGQTDIATPWFSPPNEWFYGRFGVTNVAGAALPVQPIIDYTISLTYYVTLWDPIYKTHE